MTMSRKCIPTDYHAYTNTSDQKERDNKDDHLRGGDKAGFLHSLIRNHGYAARK